MFRYFESAEIEFLRSINITYDIDRSIAFPRVHVECDYKSALVSDDEIEIEVRIGRIGNTSVRFDFRTTKGGDLAAKGHVAVVCMDRKTQRSSQIPEEIRRRLTGAMTAGL
jgi:YbgC/YbaW family acyl-CoA thioester hydrolase